MQEIKFMMKAVGVLIFTIMVACFSPKNEKQTLLINGAGASFPYILYSKWFSEYHKLHPKIAINYQSIGSGGGIRQFLRGTLDFGATDVVVSKKEVKQSGKALIYIPTTLGAVVVTYNLELPKKQILKLDGNVLARIFMGEIKQWNHPSIQKLNPKVLFPKLKILPIYRADGSGTTAIFTEYLAQTDTLFLKNVGKGKAVNWPVGVGGKGNEGVMGMAARTKGSISYVSASYAFIRKVPVMKIKNKKNNFVFPTKESIKAAASYVMDKEESYLVSLVNSGGKNSYPISAFTYLILSTTMPKQKGSILITFIKWALEEGQKYSYPLHFIPLPHNVTQMAYKNLSRIKLK